jgi:hypothetical protein
LQIFSIVIYDSQSYTDNGFISVKIMIEILMTIPYRNKNIIIFVLLFVFLNCSLDEPVLPKWKTKFLVPIVKEHIVFSETFKNDSTLVVKGDSLYLELAGDFEPDTITSHDLSITGVDSTASFSLNSIELDSLKTISSDTIGILQILPFLSNFVNQTIPFSDTTISSTALITDSSEFTSMKVNNGEVILSFYNNLPLTITPAVAGGNSIFISIYNELNGNHVTDIPITETIPPGSVGTGIGQLGEGDGWIYIPLRLEYQIHFQAENIFVTQDSLDAWNFWIDLTFRNLEVAEISGRVSAQTVNEILRIGIDDKNKVVEAVIDSGTIQLKFFNELPLAAQIVYTLPDIVHGISGVPLQGQIMVDPYDSMAQDVQNLQGYNIYNSQMPGQPLDTLTIYTEAITDTGFVTLKAEDSVRVQVSTSRILMNYLKGILAPDTLQLDPLVLEDIANYNNFSEGFELQGVQLLLDFDNQIQIENFQLSGNIIGYKKDENLHYTDSIVVVIPTQILSYGHNTILLQGPEVNALVSLLPNDLKTEGMIVYEGPAEVSAGDTIGGGYLFTSPFWVQISNADPIGLDPDTLEEIDEHFRRAIGDNIRSALLSGEVLNFSPLSGTMEIFISRNFSRQDLYDTTGHFNPQCEFIKMVEVPAAEVDPITGFVSQPAVGNFTIELNQQELSIFHRPPIKTGLRLHLDDTNGFVVLRGSDYLDFSGKIETEIIFKDTDE